MSHIKTAVKALQRQLKKLENDRDRWESSENTARQNKDFFGVEADRIRHQIKELEDLEIKEEPALESNGQAK
jgi:DNA repair ATPase RecN